MSQVDGAHGMSQVISAQEAIQQLLNGKVVAIPTETVYGLAASVGHPDALASIYTLKGRPKDNPMILHGASVEQLLPFVEGWSQVHQVCADAFWPGPLTLILRASKQVPSIITARLDTVAIRVPNHPLALEILEHTGPLAAPSANLSGSPSATKRHMYWMILGMLWLWWMEIRRPLDLNQPWCGLRVMRRVMRWIMGRVVSGASYAPA